MSLSSVLRRIAQAVAIFGGLVLIGVVALLVFQPTLELTHVKALFEEQLTAFVEAPVTLESVWLRPALWPTVGLRGLSVEGSGSATPFARLESAELQLGLLPLLERQIRVRSLSARGVDLRARRNPDKTGNWPVWTTFDFEVVELKGIELRDITAEYVDLVSGQRFISQLDRLSAEIGQSDPLRLEMQGRLGETQYLLAAEGPTLDDLGDKRKLPLDLVLDLGEAHVELGGEIHPRPTGMGFDLLVEAEVSEPDRLAARHDLELPPVGRLEVRSRLTALDRILALSEIRARLGETDVSGSLAIDRTLELPRITGQLEMGNLDLTPWLVASESEPAPTPRLPGSAGAHDLSLLTRTLAALSVDVGLRVERVSVPGPQIRALSARLEIEGASLRVPLELEVAGNKIRGQVEVEGDRDLHLLIDLEASALGLGELVRRVAERDAVEGTLEGFRLRAESHGTTFEQLIERLAFELRAKGGSLTYGLQAEKAPISVPVRSLALTQQAGSPMRLSASGSIFDEAVDLSLTTVNLSRLAHAVTLPFDLVARGAGAEVQAAGKVGGYPAEGRLGLDFEISGDRVGDLSGLLGISSEAELPYGMQGRLESQGSATRLRLDHGALGRSVLSGELAWADMDGTPLVEVDLRSSVVDPQGLALIVLPIAELDADDDSVEIESPILTKDLRIDNADIHLVVDRVLREPVDLTDLETRIRFRDGKMEESPFALSLGETDFRGSFALDMSGALPEGRLRLTAEDVDLGNLLAQEELVGEVELTVERLEVDYVARGSTPSELFRRSQIQASLRRARWLVSEPASEKALEILIDRAEISGPEHQPLELEAAGTINKAPFEVTGTLDLPTTIGEERVVVPLNLTATVAGAHLEVTSDIDLPLDRERLKLDLLLAGERLDTLSPLVGIDLPPAGPYRLSTAVEIGEASYALPNLELVIDDSELQGAVSLAYGAERPRLTAELRSRRLDLEDLLAERRVVEPGPGRDSTTAKVSGKRPGEEPREPLLTADLLSRADAYLDLRLEAVHSKEQLRGGGELIARLEDGHLQIHPFRLSLPEGAVDLRVDAEAIDSLLDIALDARIESLDYGALLERFDTASREAGTLSLNSRLRGRAPSMEELLVYADGHFDFTLYPENFSTTLLDLWATHLLTALVPRLDAGSGPQLNCVVGRFTVDSGLMTPDQLLIDTSRIRVKGKGKIDLQTGKLDLTLRPRPKTRGFISLATPARVTGRLEDPSIRLTTTGLARTFFRLSMWFWTAYLELLRKPLPADGADVCIDPPPREVESLIGGATTP